MVLHVVANHMTGVRFPLPAPNEFFLLILKDEKLNPMAGCST